jgi:hypothetical protein
MCKSDATRFLYRLACFLPLVGALLLIDWIGEQVPVRRRFIGTLDDAADALVAGKTIWTRADLFNIKAVWIEHSPMRPDVVVLGSSRVIQIPQAWFGSRRMLNASLLGGDLLDAVAIFEACLETGKTPRLALLELNPSLVFADRALISPALAGYLERALLRYRVFPPIFFSGPLSLQGMRWNPQLFSRSRVWKVSEKLDPGGVVLRPDGTSDWSVAALEASPDEVEQTAIWTMHHLDPQHQQWRAGSRPGWFNLRILQAFLDDLQARGIRVVVMLLPVHPVAFDYYVAQGGYDDSWIKREMAARGLTVVGSYSPKAVKATRDDFFDDVHVRTPVLHRLLREAGIVE